MIKFLSVFLITFSWLAVASTQNLSLDKQLGAENAKMVEAQMGIYPDEEKTAYIRRVGERLITQLEKPLFDYPYNNKNNYYELTMYPLNYQIDSTCVHCFTWYFECSRAA